MKKMKRALSAVLALMLLLMLAACNSESSEGSSTPPASDSPAAQTQQADPGTAVKEDWPESTVYVYVPTDAGANTDLIARVYAEFFEKYTGKTFSIVNDSSGQGSVVQETVKASTTDGLDLLVFNDSHFGGVTMGMSSYLPLNNQDGTMLGMLGVPIEQSTNVLLVQANAPYDTLDEFIAYAKDHPGELRHGIFNGGAAQYMAALMDDIFGIDQKLVDAGTTSEKIVALIGGNIELITVSCSFAQQYIESGDVKALCVLGEERNDAIADVPAVTELGYDAFEICQYFALVGPPNMDPATVNAINAMVRAANEDPAVIEGMQNLTLATQALTSDETCARLTAEYDVYAQAYEIVQSKTTQ